MAEDVLREKLELVADDQASGPLKKVADTYDEMAKKLASGGSTASAALDAVAGKASGAETAIKGLRDQVVLLIEGLVGGAAIKAFVTGLFEATKHQEDLVLTVAATMAATNGWSRSMEIAGEQLTKLKQTGALVGATEDQMVQTFTMLKRTFGGTSDEAVTLTKNLGLLARQSGASVDELANRLAQASITGTLMARGPAGIALTGKIDPEELMRMKEAGQAMEYLNAKIADNPELVEHLKNTWSYLGADLARTKEEAMETIGQGLEPLKQAVKDMTDRLNGPETQAAFVGIGNNLAMLNTQLLSLVPASGGGNFFVGIGATILKGANVFLADIIFITKELNVAVGFFWDFLTNPDKYFSAGGKARLQTSLDAVVKLYQDNEAKIKKIVLGLPANILDTDRGPAEHPPEVPTAPGGDRIKQAKDLAQQMADLTRETWAQVDAFTQEGLAKELGMVEAETQKEIDAISRKAITAQQLSAATAAFEALGDAKKWALIEADSAKREAAAAKLMKQQSENADWLLKEQAKLYDDLGAVSDSYYVKQQASIDKMIDRETALLDKRLDDDKLTQEAYDALMGTLQKLYDAQTAQLLQEQNSIIGFRRTMQEQADLLVKTTDSVAGGILAGMKTIAAGVKSTTEITRDYIVGIYGALSTGLGSVLQTLETGTGSIKDALKGILNSLLQSFNTMVTQMVQRWLFGKEEMKGGSSPLDSLFGGAGAASSIDASGNVVYHGGTIDMTTKGQGTQATRTQAQPSNDMQIGSTVAFMALAGISASSGSTTLMGSPVAQAATTIAAALATYGLYIVAVIVEVVGVIASALTPRPKDIEASYKGSAMAQALKLGHAFGAAGSDLEVATTAALTMQNSMTGFFADVFKDIDPSVRGSILKDLNDKMLAYFAGLGDFGTHAGAMADFKGDVTKLFTQLLPAQIMHEMFGQTTNMIGDPGGITGGQLAPGGKWGSTSSYSAVDEKSPLVGFLTSIGFSIAKVNEIAGMIDTKSAEDFQKYFAGLVGLVLSAQKLGGLLKQTYAEMLSADETERLKSPAEKMAPALANVTQLLKDVSFYAGDEQITKGNEAIAAAQQFYDNAKAAMLQLSAMAIQTTQDVADETKKIQDALKTPGDLFAQSTVDLAHDYERMRFASNPEDLAKAWAQAKSDFEAVAGELVNRIKQIRSLLDDIHTLQAAIANGPGADQQSDPKAWLAENMVAIGKYQAAMASANPGSPEQIAAATTMAGLIRDRYQMELQLLDRIKSAILSINDTIDQQLFNIDLGEAKRPGDKASLIYGKINELYAQMQQPGETPEQIAGIVSQITGLTTQLLQLAPAGTPGHDQMVAYVRTILGEVRGTSNRILGQEATDTQTDISKLGTKLSEAETRMAAALTKDQYDLDALVFHFNSAGTYMTGKLNAWGVEIAGQLNALSPILSTMVGNFTDVNTALSGSGGTGGGHGGPDGFIPVIQDATAAVAGFAAAARGVGGPAGNSARIGTSASAPPPVNVTVNVTSGAPEDVAQAVVEAVYPVIVSVVRTNNRETTRMYRNNPGLLRKTAS